MEQGYRFEPEPFSPWCRRLTVEPRPLGSSLAATFGLIYIQDRSSMLPPLALAAGEAPGAGAAVGDPAHARLAGAGVLDMCASPGSKTGFLAQLVGPRGFALGNEPSRERNATLRRNLADMNLAHAAVSAHPGQELPLADGSWDNILLDPPCSGWGTADKHPSVLTLWTGDKAETLAALQRALLAEAARLLAPGGRLVYSTCTTNPAENEAQVRFAVDELGLEVVTLPPFAGFCFAEPGLAEARGTLLVDGERSGAQGFYVALLRRPGERGAGAETGPRAGAESVAAARDGAGRFAGKAEAVTDADLAVASDQGAAWDNLPDGELLRFGDNVFFLPRAALALPDALRWQGMALGRAGRGGLRLNPRLRLLLPGAERGGVDLDGAGGVALIERLLTGQSLALERAPEHAGLYWRSLPLGWLTLKGARALWSGR
jgi:16S rRNA (cytosine1407-C5)-methyltransferase